MSPTDPTGLSEEDRFESREIRIHGRRVMYRMAGEGPPVVLIHGMINSSRHWKRVALDLADSYTVIAPDLIGHGESATPRGDYSLGAHAAWIRDLLTAIGIERATIVGHSLGGGVAMQFFYQFPQRTERMILISSGGLGREVSLPLRGASMPGSELLLALAVNRVVVGGLNLTGRILAASRRRLGVHLQAIARALRPLAGSGQRRAFRETLKAVIDIRGQKVSATDRLYLLDDVPTLILWGERDGTIPPEHGRMAHAAIADSHFELIPGVAHFPNLEAPERLAATIHRFLDASDPKAIPDRNWGELVLSGSPSRRTDPATGSR